MKNLGSDKHSIRVKKRSVSFLSSSHGVSLRHSMLLHSYRRPTVGREASSEAAHGAERQSHVIRSGRMSFTRYSLLHYASLTVRSLASLLPSLRSARCAAYVM